LLVLVRLGPSFFQALDGGGRPGPGRTLRCDDERLFCWDMYFYPLFLPLFILLLLLVDLHHFYLFLLFPSSSAGHVTCCRPYHIIPYHVLSSRYHWALICLAFFSLSFRFLPIYLLFMGGYTLLYDAARCSWQAGIGTARYLIGILDNVYRASEDIFARVGAPCCARRWVERRTHHITSHVWGIG
jgi:hypothetical protein